jgi:hypothetical protein
MDIPKKKHASSPITGRSSKKAKPEDSAAPKPGAKAPEEEDGEDIAISEEVFQTPVIDLPARTSSKKEERPKTPEREKAKKKETEEPQAGDADGLEELPRNIPRLVNPPTAEKQPPPSDETGEKGPKKKNLEHREPEQPFQFKRLIRPETAMAAHAAVDHARAESPASLESVDHTAMQFGKIHRTTMPDYRPNRLFRVLDSIYTHSPLKWLDFIERGGVRFVAGTILLLVIGGFVAWRYYDSLNAKEEAGAVQVKELTVSERVDRGKKAVQEFLSAQTVEARVAEVIDPKRAGAKMQEFYGTMKGGEPKVTTWEVGEPVTGKQGTWLPFIFQDAAGRKVTVVIEETEEGCRIDWENFVAFGDMPWQEYCAPPRDAPERISPKTMRVRMRRSESYGGHYTAEKYQAYEIEHRSGPPKLLGYVERAGRTGQTLADVVKGDLWQSAQLYLQFEKQGIGNQITILDIVRSRWQDEATSWTGP